MNPIFWLLVAWVLFFILVINLVKQSDKKKRPDEYDDDEPWGY